uniref:Uncharacterized protein n=1 Tax=Globodera rostochiensis TaxID=31243 RepID=A0A914GU31_GLORO
MRNLVPGVQKSGFPKIRSILCLLRDCIRLKLSMDSKTNSIFGLALGKCLNRSQRWKRMQIRGHWAFELPTFWKTALRVYRLLRKLNQQNLAEPFYRFSQRQEKSGCSYQPTKKAMCYLGALLLRRLSLLDKLLFLSGRSADSSMGYIELRHMLTFNLMSVAMLSEIASQASRQMLQLADIYLGLSVWFRKYSKRFPSTMDALQQSLMQHQLFVAKLEALKRGPMNRLTRRGRNLAMSICMPLHLKRRGNIDQLLREDLIFKRPANPGFFQLEAEFSSKSFAGRKILFEESCDSLKGHELVDFDSVVVLEGMDAFVGTASGILKGLNLSKSSFVNLRASISSSDDDNYPNASATKHQLAREQPEFSGSSFVNCNAKPLASAVTAMSFSGPDQMEVLVGRKNGRVDLFSTVTDQFNEILAMPQLSEVKGVHRIDGDRILTAQECGTLAVCNASGERQSNTNWTAGENLLTMRIGPGETPELFATGGRENPLKLWNLAEEKCVFTAKNVRPNALELRVPIWVTCCRFLGDTGKVVVTTTGKSQLRLYDLRVQRRPIIEEQWLEDPILALSTSCQDSQVLAGNSRGELGLFDLRSSTKTRLVCKFKGFAGAIRHIDASASHPQFLSCGIDRFAIVHDLNSRKVIQKVYCKVQLKCCLLCADNSLVTPSAKTPKYWDKHEEGTEE